MTISVETFDSLIADSVVTSRHHNVESLSIY